MLKVDERLACTEALAVYNILDKETKEKIPADFVEYLRSHININYTPQIVTTLPIEEQLCSRYSMELIEKMLKYVR